jgi:hypothetical protein
MLQVLQATEIVGERKHLLNFMAIHSKDITLISGQIKASGSDIMKTVKVNFAITVIKLHHVLCDVSWPYGHFILDMTFEIPFENSLKANREGFYKKDLVYKEICVKNLF